MLMFIQNMVRFCQFVLKILSANEILTSIKGYYSVKIVQKMMGNNPKLGLVNVDVHTKFCQILSIGSQDIEQKPNIHGIRERQGESSIAPLFQRGAIKRHFIKKYNSFCVTDPQIHFPLLFC